ncbi:MAG: hypothetical protein HY039_12545 [Nitrospirae bacterium]|nr:hypothetical protein [Nitrospirota bacterium]
MEIERSAPLLGGFESVAGSRCHGPAEPKVIPPGIVPRSNPDGSLTFSSTFEASGEKTLRLKLYYNGREFTHDLPVSVEPGPKRPPGGLS